MLPNGGLPNGCSLISGAGNTTLVDPLRLALGQRIRHLRQKKGWSQERFAHEAGIHRTYAGALERGEKNVSLDSLAKVSRCLDVTLSELMRGIDKMVGRNER